MTPEQLRQQIEDKMTDLLADAEPPDAKWTNFLKVAVDYLGSKPAEGDRKMGSAFGKGEA